MTALIVFRGAFGVRAGFSNILFMTGNMYPIGVLY